MDIVRFIVALTSTLLLLMASPAEAAEQPSPRTISDITALLDQYKPDPKVAEQNRAKARAEVPEGLSGAPLALFLSDRAYAAAEMGDAKSAIADLRRAVETTSTSDPVANRNYQRNLANMLITGGSALESQRINEGLLSSTALPPSKVIYANSLIGFHSSLGNGDNARSAWRVLEDAYAKAPRSPQTDKFAFRARAAIAGLDGKWVEAEAALRRALAAAEADVDVRKQVGSRVPPGTSEISLQTNAQNVHDSLELNLVQFLIQRNRLDEAELILRTLLKRVLSRQGAYSVRGGRTIQQFATLLTAQGRHAEATIAARAAVRSYELGGAVPETRGLAAAWRTLATSLTLESRWPEALAAYEQMSKDLAVDADSLTLFGGGDAYWGLALLKSGRAHDAVALLTPRIDQERKVLGEAHPRLAFTRGVLGMALVGTGERQRALAEFRAAMATLLALRGERDAAQLRLMRHIIESYIGLLLEIQGTPLENQLKADAASEAFVLADRVRSQNVQGAMSAAAARAAAGDVAIAELVRKEQDLGGLINSVYGYLINQVSLRPEEQSPRVIADLQKRVAAMSTERGQLREELQRRFPRYADFVNPRPATLDQARAALREGEVLLSVLTTQDRTYVWAVPKQGAVTFHAAGMGETEIAQTVASLRVSLEPGEVAISRVPEFDVGRAAKLYETLLKPVEGAWKGATTLLVVASGALAQLPFGVMPTGPATVTPQALRFEHYKSVPWLIKQIAVTQLPAVNTLVTLRALPQGNAQRSAFAGFGDPQFSAQQAVAPAPMQVAMRNLGIRRVTDAALRDGSAPVNYIPYGSLPPLPDTREEILAIAQALKADISRDVFLGTQASKQSLKNANLANRRIVAFATHGLVPGDFPNLDQPALALSAPDGKAESGLLTLQDILQLKLDADWVVLSACNTAAGDGAGAEAISGLGRGFFYAGTRALLVTHWPVETVSAKNLVTKIFERYAADPALTRAEALRQAHLSVMGENAIESGKPAYSYAHPLFWAPYALVGDGGR